MKIKEYIKNISKRYASGISREHSYRGDLQNLLSELLPKLMVTNEPARIECGAPDFILTRKDVPVGYIEAKDIGEPLTGKKHKEQFERYRESLPNIIFTDYLDFHYYREGEFVDSVRIGEIAGNSVRLVAANEEKFLDLIRHFSDQHLQTIRSSSKLSKMMAAKARLLAEVIEKAVLLDEEYRSSRVDSALRDQLSAFQNVLIHDINEKEFADIYAQTISYGMFAARLHDKDLETFSRFEAARLIPKSNPFLRKLFQYIAGYDLDDRIAWIVDALADLFRATDVAALLRDFGKSTQQTDPIIHFYETFLAEFDPKLRKSRGVWYTPEPVVNFIVRAVDDILKTEFGLKDGLADTSKTKVKVKLPTHDKRRKSGMVEEEREVHKVQILDPAAGTGTFLAEVIRQIHKKFEGQQGIWPDYVENHLIPRLNGFEILMASYAMAHLKLDMLLKETGYDRESEQRFRVYLTNSLEEDHENQFEMFAKWLSDEANEANHIKRDTPVMVVLGNPPYSINSSNLTEKQRDLVKHYKFVNGNKIVERSALQLEKNLNDDYVKFLAFGESLLEKNGNGILAFINNNNFLDAPTLRGMRWNLMKSYNKMYIINLHGNSYQKEKTTTGENDENVFDIQQGVSINIFIKSNRYPTDCDVNYFSILDTRLNKYEILQNSGIYNIKYKKLEPLAPEFYFVEKNVQLFKLYKEFFSVNELIPINVTGVKTHRDHFVIGYTKDEIIKGVKEFYDLSIDLVEIKKKLSLKDTGTWNSSIARTRGKFDLKYFKR